MSDVAQALASVSTPAGFLTEAVRRYWDVHIHDLQLVTHPVGSPEFFDELQRYRYNKLDYLAEYVQFDRFKDECILEVGCGVGIDLARFARAGAAVVGIDLAERPVELAKENFRQQGLSGTLRTMDAEDMSFEDESFDAVFAHGVLPYTPDPARLVAEVYRVLRRGGVALLMAYNRWSWLSAVSKVTATALEHQDAPVYRMFTGREFRLLLSPFRELEITPERFPVPTELHEGWKARIYNHVFVRAFRLVPRPFVRPLGWHWLARAHK